MITHVTSHRSSVPATETTPVQSNRVPVISSPSFRDVLVNHIPSADNGSLPNAIGPARAPVLTTTKSSLSATTTAGSSTTTTDPGICPTPFGTAVVNQPVTPSLITLFTPKPSAAVSGPSTVPAPQPQVSPTPQSVFGSQVWAQDANYSAPDGSVRSYNPIYFASAATAQKVADMVGGKVVPMNMMAYAGGMLQSQPNLMVQLPNGKLVNPGLIADFYNHGYPQSYVDALVQNEIRGAVNS
jgi:hypothetical protein